MAKRKDATLPLTLKPYAVCYLARGFSSQDNGAHSITEHLVPWCTYTHL